MRSLINWDEKPATVTNETFKLIKDYVLRLKEKGPRKKIIFSPSELRKQLEKSKKKLKLSNEQILIAVGHLGNHGYVTRLKTSQGAPGILIAPELLNNLAASFVLEARRNYKGLGSLDERLLLAGKYSFPELKGLSKSEKDLLLDSAVVLFLAHNICFRETDPLNGNAYLVFPELINLKKPTADETPIEEGIAYTVSGAIENVYASLVVLLGYTQTFTRTNQWQNQARYEFGDGLVCGFRVAVEREGELEFVLYFGTSVGKTVRTLFQSLFESFLARRNLNVSRYEPIICGNPICERTLERSVVRQRLKEGKTFAFCNNCGEKLSLIAADQSIQLTQDQANDVEAQRRTADRRVRFEQVIFRLKSYVADQKIVSPECFISYAWGNPDHEIWVEKMLATDLLNAGIKVVFDKWDNARIGASVPRFVERVVSCDRVILVGTSEYRTKYENKTAMGGFVLAAEGDLIGKRMIGTQLSKENVLPVLLDGSEEASFPPIIHGRVYADFRKPDAYFDTIMDLLLSLYQLPPQHPVAEDLRRSLN
jgi:TIR domain